MKEYLKSLDYRRLGIFALFLVCTVFIQSHPAFAGELLREAAKETFKPGGAGFYVLVLILILLAATFGSSFAMIVGAGSLSQDIWKAAKIGSLLLIMGLLVSAVFKFEDFLEGFME